MPKTADAGKRDTAGRKKCHAFQVPRNILVIDFSQLAQLAKLERGLLDGRPTASPSHNCRTGLVQGRDQAGSPFFAVPQSKEPPMNKQIVQWNPFQELEQMHNRLTSLIEGRQNGPGNSRASSALQSWAPVVDITEDHRAYLVKVELPGVRKEDVHVTFEDGILTVAGERKQEHEEKTRKFHRLERSYGSFSRSFDLPENADPEKIEAHFRDGVLAVSVAKSESALPRQIEVKVN
jgi:HSP20 family protein